MVVMVALLRGINVGGRGSLAMADLRAVATALGLHRVRTYIQSGNLLFASADADPTAIAVDLAEAIAASTSVSPLVVVRTAHELAAVVGLNPFADRDLAKVHVIFRAGPASLGIDDLSVYAPEEAAVIGRETYVYLPDGAGRSKLAADLARRGTTGTMRNWRTVTKLLEMSSEMASGQ